MLTVPITICICCCYPLNVLNFTTYQIYSTVGAGTHRWNNLGPPHAVGRSTSSLIRLCTRRDYGGLRVPLRREYSKGHDTLFIGSVHRSGHGLCDRWIWTRFPLKAKIPLRRFVEPSSGAHRATQPVGTGGISSRCNTAWCEAGQPSSASVKHMWSCTSTPACCHDGAP